MKSIWKILLFGVVILIIVAAFLFFQPGAREGGVMLPKPDQGTTQHQTQPGESPASPTPLASTETQTTPAVTITPTGDSDIDEVINGLLSNSISEGTVVSEENNDASLINADSQAISDFGQSYDEKGF